MLVKEILKKVIEIPGDNTLKESTKVMVKHDIGCLIINSGEDIAGIITERDILIYISKDSASLDHKVKDIMTTKIITIDPDKHIDDAAKLMSKHKIKKLPIVKDGKILGIITSTDLIANSADFGNFSLFE